MLVPILGEQAYSFSYCFVTLLGAQRVLGIVTVARDPKKEVREPNGFTSGFWSPIP